MIRMKVSKVKKFGFLIKRNNKNKRRLGIIGSS